MTTHSASPSHPGPDRPEAPLAPARPFHPEGRPGRLLVAEDVAALLGVPPTFVYALARRGELPSVRVGERYIRFRAQAIEDWIDARETSDRWGVQ